MSSPDDRDAAAFLAEILASLVQQERASTGPQEPAPAAPKPQAKPEGPEPCPRCGARMQRVLGRNGAFYGCINYPNCRGSRNIKTGPGACPTCGAPTEARVGRNGPFYGCTKYPDCKGTLNFDLDTVLTLPKPVPKKKPAKPPRAQPPPTPLQPGLLDPAPPLPPDLLYDPEDEQDASQDEDDEPWLFDDE